MEVITVHLQFEVNLGKRNQAFFLVSAVLRWMIHEAQYKTFLKK
jgi:hypothetical protein